MPTDARRRRFLSCFSAAWFLTSGCAPQSRIEIDRRVIEPDGVVVQEASDCRFFPDAHSSTYTEDIRLNEQVGLYTFTRIDAGGVDVALSLSRPPESEPIATLALSRDALLRGESALVSALGSTGRQLEIEVLARECAAE